MCVATFAEEDKRSQSAAFTMESPLTNEYPFSSFTWPLRPKPRQMTAPQDVMTPNDRIFQIKMFRQHEIPEILFSLAANDVECYSKWR